MAVIPHMWMDNAQFVSTVQANLMKYGYMLDREAFEAMATTDLAWIKEWHDEIINYLRTQLGDDKEYRLFYNNFPDEVMEKSDCEIFFERILHYWSNGTWIPESKPMTKELNFEFVKYKEIKFATEEEFKNIFKQLVSLNQSLTPQDQEAVDWFVDEYGKDLPMPSAIPFKETLCRLASKGLNVPVKTATDVLRIAAYMSYGSAEISLPKRYVKENAWDHEWVLNPELEKMKFRKFSYDEKMHLLGLLEKTGANKYEMAIWKKRWIRLGEKLKPGRYKDRFPLAFASFDYLRNAKHTRTWYSFVEQAFERSLEEGLERLAERPGEFLRRLDALLRNNAGQEELVLSYFQRVGVGASNKVLFSLLKHFKDRTKRQARSVLHKKALKRIDLPTLEPISAELNDAILATVKEILAEKFSQLDDLGKCWIDPNLKNVAMPEDMRTMLESDVVVTRGSRVRFDNPEAKVIRFYVHWDAGSRGTDLDLSAYLYRDNGHGIDLYYGTTGLKIQAGNDIIATHSGDVRNVPGPCAEYIDIDIEKALKQGFRYVMMKVHDFSGAGLNKQQTVCGFMEREHPEANNLTWRPDTVANAIKLDTPATTVNIMILDLKTREYIMVIERSSGYPSPAVDSTGTPIALQKYLEPPKFSVYDLLELHAKNRGQLVPVEEAETQFLYDDFVSSYEALGEWMGV